MKARQLVYIAIIGTFLGAAVGFGLKLADAPETAGSPITSGNSEEISQVPNFAYPDIDGKMQDSKQWDAKILVLNFWAAWCPPCREETPAFVALQEKYGSQNVRFVGIAIDDLEPVVDFADTYGVNYPILMGDVKAISLSRKLGNRFEGLPYTVVAMPGGETILRHSGGLSKEQLEPVLLKAIEASRRTTAPAARI